MTRFLLLLLPWLSACATETEPAAPGTELRPRLRLRKAPSGPAVVKWRVDVSGWEDRERRGRAEWLGRAAVAMEMHLYRRVVPIGPAGRPPAVTDTPLVDDHVLTLVPHDDGRVEASLCTAAGDCEIHFAAGEPEAIGTRLAAAVLEQLGMPAPAPTCLAGPPSVDDYANLITGRSAATVYGWWPRSERLGDPRVDPIPRAVFLDPTAGSAQWLAGREAWRRGEEEDASPHLHSAARACADVEGLAADDAISSALAGRDRGAFPDDDRFLFARLDAGLARSRPDTYARALAAVQRWPRDPRLEARAAAAAPEEAVEAHLTRWAQLDEENPRPVRKLARRALEVRSWERLLELCEELERRGVDTARWRTPALLALGRIADARDGSPTAIRDLVAARAGAPSSGSRPEDLLLQAEQRLELDPEGALQRCDQVLALRPHWPEALALAARAARAAGRPDGVYMARLREVEP